MGAPRPEAAQAGRFGTIVGVFRPVFLTILGALFYLRLGWLVGNCGLGGAFLVLLLGASVTGFTSLSVASIATNIRVRAGGAFAIIAQSLGLEAGGAIGLPLYLAQALSAPMYAYAFSEAFVRLVPVAEPRVVALAAFAFVAFLAWKSAGLAFRVQAILFVLVLLALGSVFAGWFTAPELVRPRLVGDFAQADLRRSFAIFFPAFTGIMVGVGMSGDLRSPRRSIPRGTLAAWAVTTAIYFLGAAWYGTVADEATLLSHRTVIFDRAAVGGLVMLGLLTSTLTAALSSLVAAPRLLQAMAELDVLPGSRWLARTVDGEPRNATVLSTALGAAGLLAGSLDAVAPIITAFFVTTFLAINVVVYIEQLVGMISWRPTFQVPRAVTLAGVAVSLLALTVGSPFGGSVEIAVIVGLYAMLVRRRLRTPWETVRSGAVTALAEWIALRASRTARSQRAWRPDVLMPVFDALEIEALRPLLAGLTRDHGSVRLVVLGHDPETERAAAQATLELRDEGIEAWWTAISTTNDARGVAVAVEALQGALFPPNLLLLHVGRFTNDDVASLSSLCRRLRIGMGLVAGHPASPMRPSKGVTVWLSDRSPDWSLRLHLANLDLPVLTGWLLHRACRCPLHLATVVRDPASAPEARRFLADLVEQARLARARTWVGEGPFLEALARGPEADLHLFGMPPSPDPDRLAAIRDAAGGTCLFLQDSGIESALA